MPPRESRIRIPVYKLDGIMVLYFAGFQHHYSIYPATTRVVSTLEKELAGLLHSKATIRFPLVDKIPTGLITRIAKLRATEVADLKRAKAVKNAASQKAKAQTRGQRAKSR